MLEIKGATAVLELGTADLSVSGKPGTRVSFYRTGADLLLRILSGRLPPGQNRIPASGTLLLPYLKHGVYDICVGEMSFRKRIHVTGKGAGVRLE